MHQLPELYAGTGREATNFPVQYLGANVPQAWAAGSVFAFTQAIVGAEGDAVNRKLHLDPVLPAWLPNLMLHNVVVGDQAFDLKFTRTDESTVTEVLNGDAGNVVVRPFCPVPTA